jgi:FkbM family methyltransferase
LSSLYFKLLYPEALILAVEPDKANYSILCKNTSRINGFVLYNNAISSVSGHGYLYQSDDTQPWSIRTLADKPETGLIGVVEYITIPELMKTHRIEAIDILKIDIEGSEKVLFDSNYIDWLPSVKNIVIEIHDHISPGAGQAVFRAVHECFPEYSLFIKGSNIVISRSDR